MKNLDRMRTKTISLKIITTIILGFGMISCGGSGGGGGSDGGGTTAPTTNTGIFIDSPVQGIQYSTPTLSGTTDNQGIFQYKDGEIVTFKIGNLVLGNATGESVITPLTLVGESDLDNIGTKATNIARLLQSLDENSSNVASIKIPYSLKNLDISNIDLGSEDDLNAILTEAQSITSKVYTLKDSTTAKAEMKKFIKYYDRYSSVENKSYTKKGATFLKFCVGNNEKLNISFNGGYADIKIYDIDLNLLRSYEGSGGYGSEVLKSFSNNNYIIRINNHYSTSSIQLTKVDSYFIKNLISVENKSYIKSGATFLKFDVMNSEKIHISFNGGYARTKIYNNDLKLIYTFEGSSGYGSEVLKALSNGSYIIKINNQNSESSVQLTIL